MDETPCTARCQSCNLLTSRKCSACNVCSYCSAECEASATTECSADVACKLHLAWPHEATNLGPSGAHFLMLPCMQTPLAADAAPHLRWTALHQATVHYLHVMLARSPSRVHSKTAFGLSVALTPELRYSCGCQRLVFPIGKTSQAASMVVGNMATLAHAQLGEERVSAPQLRDVRVPDKRQAVILSGLVAKAQGGLAHEDPEWVVHFDSIYLTHANNTWTVKRVQPLWEQKLTKLDDHHYHMGFKPEGRVPPNTRHSLELLEKALSPLPASPPPPTPSEPPPARCASCPVPARAVPTPSLSPTPASTTPPEAPPPPPPASPQAAARASRATPRTTPPQAAPSWESYREQAGAAAAAATVAPPWLDQLREALQQA